MFDNIFGTIARGAFRLGLIMDKHSPELLMVAGLAAGAAAIYTTVTATLKVNEVMEEVNANKELVENTRAEHPDVYSEENYVRDMKVIKKDAALGMIKLYYKPALFFLLSTTCYFAAHKILKDRNVAIAAALKATQMAFDKYRERVREKEGIEADRYYRFGGPDDGMVTIATENPDGTKTDIRVFNGNHEYSQYARCFTFGNPNWKDVPEYNYMFLKSQQNYLNDMLRARGHLFLNEVYRALGFEDSKAGAVVGWVISKNGGDNFVDFGLYDLSHESGARFVNGQEPSVWLDFNVDGVIYDKI